MATIIPPNFPALTSGQVDTANDLATIWDVSAAGGQGQEVKIPVASLLSLAGSGGGGGAGVTGVYTPQDYGAIGDGQADDTAALNSWIAVLNAADGRKGVWPAGTYKVTQSLTALTRPGVVIEGGGKRVTNLLLVPSGSGMIGLHFNVTQDFCSLSGVTITSADLSYTKTGLQVTDARMFRCRDVEVSFSGGLNSIGFVYKGRELPYLESCVFRAPLPVAVYQNPNYAQLTMDAVRWVNVQTIAGGADGVAHPASGLVYANVLIETGATITNWSVDTLIMKGGLYGIFTPQTSAAPGGLESGAITLTNVRHEQPTGSTGYAFFFNFGFGVDYCRTITAINCAAGWYGAGNTSNGCWYFRNIHSVVLINCDYPTSGNWLDIDLVQSFTTVGCDIHYDAVVSGLDNTSQSGLKLSTGSGSTAYSKVPYSGTWVYQTEPSTLDQSAVKIAPIAGMRGGYMFARNYTLTNGTQALLPLNVSRGITYGQVWVTAVGDSDGSQLHEGHFALMTHLITSGPVVGGIASLDSSASVVNTDTAGKLCLYCQNPAAALDGVALKNNLGYTARVSVFAVVGRSAGYI
jgi:hypothetical protein